MKEIQLIIISKESPISHELWAPKNEQDVGLFIHITGGLDRVRVKSLNSYINSIAEAHNVVFTLIK